MMSQQAEMNAMQHEQGDMGASMDGISQVTKRLEPPGVAAASDLPLGLDTSHFQHSQQQLQQQQQQLKSLAEDDVLPRLEAMVEDLAGASSFTLVENLEDACSNLDAAREALTKFREVLDSGLRHSAPNFVPGEMWTGRQQSGYVD